MRVSAAENTLTTKLVLIWFEVGVCYILDNAAKRLNRINARPLRLLVLSPQSLIQIRSNSK